MGPFGPIFSHFGPFWGRKSINSQKIWKNHQKFLKIYYFIKIWKNNICPFLVQKSSWSLILSPLPYFNLLHYPNVTSLSCKGRATFSFRIFCIRVAPAFLDWSWARCDEHVTIETRTSIFRLYVRPYVRPSVRTSH